MSLWHNDFQQGVNTMSWKRFRASKGPRKPTRGQALVEFALVSVVLFFLILGIIDVARLLFTYSVITNAAQEGSRYGIVRPRQVVPNAKVTYVAGNPTYLGTVIPTQIVTAASPCDIVDKTIDTIYGVPRSDVQISVWYDNGDSTPLPLTNEADLNAAAVFGNRIDVQTSYTFSFLTPFMSIFAPNGINVRMLSARTLRTTGNADAPPCDFVNTIAPTPNVPATQTAVAGMTQTAVANASSTAVAGYTQTAIVVATQTAAGFTATPTATPTACTASGVVIANISAFVKSTGGSNPLGVRVHVTDNCNIGLLGATVTGQVQVNGSNVGGLLTLPSEGGGDYGFASCSGPVYSYANNMTIVINAAKTGLISGAATGNVNGANTCP
jgi:Flp pilus assembly protein TadG